MTPFAKLVSAVFLSIPNEDFMVKMYRTFTAYLRCKLENIKDKFLHLDAVRFCRFDCLPGTVDVWNLLLSHMMLELRLLSWTEKKSKCVNIQFTNLKLSKICHICNM